MDKKSSKNLIGTVVANKMLNTVTVNVDSIKTSALYRKKYKVSKKIKAHTDSKDLEIGDLVEIKQSRPISKSKKFVVVGKVK